MTSRAVLLSSFQAMTSSVIYYSTHVRQNEIYLLNKVGLFYKIGNSQHYNNFHYILLIVFWNENLNSGNSWLLIYFMVTKDLLQQV